MIEERIVIVDGGSELYSVTVSPLPTMVSTVAKRIDPGPRGLTLGEYRTARRAGAGGVRFQL